MMQIPELDTASVAFGNIKHMPRYDTLPEQFTRHRGTVFNEAVSSWFFNGAHRNGDVITMGKHSFKPKAGVDMNKALRAIKAVLGSFEPKHEHKEAACAYMLAEWFDVLAPNPQSARASDGRD